MLVNPLVNFEFLNLSIFFFNFVPNYIAASTFHPGVWPGSKIILNLERLSSIINVADKIWKLGVLESIFLKVRSNTNLENFGTKKIKSLLQPWGSFTIRYSIKDVLSHISIDDVTANWMCGILLINLKSGIACVQKDTPCILVLFKPWSLIKAPIRNVICERLVKPQVIPPLHGDKISKPHVRDLMQECIVDRLSSIIRILILSLDIIISVNHTSYIFHCSHIIVRDPNLVKLCEWIWGREEFLIEIDSAFAHMEIFFLDWSEPLWHWFSWIKLHWHLMIFDSLIFWLMQIIWACNNWV